MDDYEFTEYEYKELAEIAFDILYNHVKEWKKERYTIRDAMIFCHRANILGFYYLTYEDCGKKFHLQRERIRQITMRCARAIRVKLPHYYKI